MSDVYLASLDRKVRPKIVAAEQERKRAVSVLGVFWTNIFTSKYRSLKRNILLVKLMNLRRRCCKLKVWAAFLVFQGNQLSAACVGGLF